MSIRSLISIVLVAAVAMCLPAVAHAASATWNVNLDGDWTTNANWTPNTTHPDGVGETANLRFNITAARVVNLNANQTIGILNIGDITSTFVAFTLSSTNGSLLTLDNTGSTDVQINKPVQSASSAADQISVALQLNDNLVITNSNTNEARSLTISGNISESGGAKTVTVNGPGVATNATTATIFSGNNSYTGQTTVTATSATGRNTLRIQSANALGTTAGNTVLQTNGTAGTRLEIDGTFTTSESIAIGGMSTDPASTPALSPRIVSSSGVNTVSGDITTVDNLDNLGGSNYLIRSDNDFTISGDVRQTNGLVSALWLGNGSAPALGTISGVIREDSANSVWHVLKHTTGTWKLSGANTYVGETVISAGQLEIANDSALGGATGNGGAGAGGYTDIAGGAATSSLGLSNNINTPEVLYVGQRDVSTAPHIINKSGSNTISGVIAMDDGDLAGSATHLAIQSDAGTLTISNQIRQDLPGTATLTLRGAANGVVSGEIAQPTDNYYYTNSVSGNVWNVVKADGGMWTLSGNNAYTGTTTVAGGTLRVNGNHTGGGTYTVNSTATLEGTGDITAAVVVNGGAVLSPGNSIGTFEVGSATISGTLKIEYNTASIDKLIVNNAIDVSAATLDLVSLGALDGTSTYVFLTYGSWNSQPFANEGSISVPGYNLVYNYNGDSFALTPVPEPSTLALAALGLAGLGLVYRKRRK